MSNRKVIWYKDAGNLIESYQSVALKFSFANEINGRIVQCHEWVKCRDFLHDAVRTMLTGKKSSIFGFSYDMDVNPPLNMNNIQMLVSQQKLTSWVKLRTDLTKALRLINHFEAMAGTEYTTIQKVQADKNLLYNHIYLLTGPKMWLTAPHLISMFTFLIRLGTKNIDKFRNDKDLDNIFYKLSKLNIHDNDITYLKTVRAHLKRLVMERESICKYNKNGFSEMYFSNIPIQGFHDHSGIVGTCKGTTNNIHINNYVKTHFNGE